MPTKCQHQTDITLIFLSLLFVQARCCVRGNALSTATCTLCTAVPVWLHSDTGEREAAESSQNSSERRIYRFLNMVGWRRQNEHGHLTLPFLPKCCHSACHMLLPYRAVNANTAAFPRTCPWYKLPQRVLRCGGTYGQGFFHFLPFAMHEELLWPRL